MAELTIILPNTHEEIPVSDVDFSLVTNTDLINKLIESGFIPEISPFSGGAYELVVPGAGIALGYETKTLEELGVKDGEKIKLLTSSQSAADSTIVLLGTHDEIPLSAEVDFSQVTNEELIFQLVISGNLPYCPGTCYYLLGKYNDHQIDEIATLTELGYVNGDKIRLLCCGGGDESSYRQSLATRINVWYNNIHDNPKSKFQKLSCWRHYSMAIKNVFKKIFHK